MFSFIHRFSLGCLLPLSLVGCATVGPDYAGPPASPAGVSHFVRHQGAQAPAPLQAAPWWESLQDEQLTQLIRQALAQSPDLQAAEARLAQARAGLEQQQANGRPKVSSSLLLGGINQAPDTQQQTVSHIYTGSVMASWELDLFGAERRGVEVASANRDAVAADLADAQLALTARLASAYVQLRSLQAQEQLVQDAQQAAQDSLTLTIQRQEQGVATAQEVEQRTSELASLQEQAEQLVSDRLVALDQIALLCGQVPAALDGQLSGGSHPLPLLPASLSIGDPAAQLQHRPDVRAAERHLAASTAQIGVQQANYFPKVTLLGGVGALATEPSALFKQSSLALLGGPMLSWDFLDFNRTTAAVSKANGARDEALANYRGSVLRALNDANSALTRYGQQSQIRMQKQVQLTSVRHQFSLVTQRRAAGVASGIELLDARRSADEASRQDLLAQAQLLDDYILLQKSLGVGWQSATAR